MSPAPLLHRISRQAAAAGAAIAALALLHLHATRAHAQSVGWPVYGGDPGGMKYSPLMNVNRTNVARLQLAWEWKVGERAMPASDSTKAARPGNFQNTPLVINDTMYVSTPFNRVVALDAATGRVLWT